MQEENVTLASERHEVHSVPGEAADSPLSLIALRPGEKGTIERLSRTEPEVQQRLLEMGLVSGSLIEVIRYAPLGGPMQVKIGRTNVSLRKQEAGSVLVRRAR